MEMCPACKTNFKQTELLEWFKYFRPRPCPNCKALIYHRIWPWFLFVAGFKLMDYGGDLFDETKSHWVRQLLLSGYRGAFYPMLALWFVLFTAAAVTGLRLGFRYTVAKEK
jgi:hypothetical protein